MNKEIEEAFWHHSSGKEFQGAFYILILDFDVVSNSWRKQISKPSYYCAGLAIEHFLKSYLVLEKITFPKNHSGHNLTNLLSLNKNKAKTFFKLDKTDTEQINILNERYYNHGSYGKDDLRYGNKPGTRKSPHPDNLNRVIGKIESKLMMELVQRYHLLGSKSK